MNTTSDRAPRSFTRDDLPVVTAAAADQLARSLTRQQATAWRRLAAVRAGTGPQIPSVLTTDFDDLDEAEQQQRRVVAVTALADAHDQLVADVVKWVADELGARGNALPLWSSQSNAEYEAARRVRDIARDLGRVTSSAVTS